MVDVERVREDAGCEDRGGEVLGVGCVGGGEGCEDGGEAVGLGGEVGGCGVEEEGFGAVGGGW